MRASASFARIAFSQRFASLRRFSRAPNRHLLSVMPGVRLHQAGRRFGCLRTRWVGDELPCRGQEAPQSALCVTSHTPGGFSTPQLNRHRSTQIYTDQDPVVWICVRRSESVASDDRWWTCVNLWRLKIRVNPCESMASEHPCEPVSIYGE